MSNDEYEQQRIMIVCGAQFGSEGKGNVAAWLASQDESTTCVRVGGPNAGHTVRTAGNKTYKLQHLPTGVVHGNKCLIAAGSEIDLGLLQRELEMLAAEGELPVSLFVDQNATVLSADHSLMETQGKPHGDAGLTQSIGSTGKGVGAARSERIWRRAQTIRQLVGEHGNVLSLGDFSIDLCNGPQLLNDDILNGCSILIEGTQGYGLGLHTSYYPFTTSGDARAIDFLAQVGLCPWSYPECDLQVWLVARTYPIRVAGNSGPLKHETSWEELGIPEEFTTVTKKRRRVGEWDSGLVQQAIVANGWPNIHFTLTMLDHAFKRLAFETNREKILEVAGDYLDKISTEIGVRITAVSTGPNSIIRL